MTSKYYSLVMALSIMIILTPALVLAQGGASCTPTRFNGDATVNGNPAPAGLTVTAKINGIEMASTITSEGRYGDSPYIFDVPDNDGNCQTSAVIDFYIEGQAAGQEMLRTEEQLHYVTLDLSATGVVIPGGDDDDDNDNPPTGGGGPPGGGYTPPACTPDWECSAWSQCLNGTQSRTCTDIDECDSDEGKPETEQTCGLETVLPSGCTVGETTCVGSDVFECNDFGDWDEVETCDKGCDKGACLVEEEPSPDEGFSITGLFLNPVMGYGLIVILIIAGVGAYLWRRNPGIKS